MDITNYSNIVEDLFKKMSSVNEDTASIRLSIDKWSLKEMIGHLVDSASNNHQRFIRLQENAEISIPQYAPEFWIKAADYLQYPWSEIVTLWHSYNKLILHIIKNVDTGCLNNIWKKYGQDLTLGFIIEDYYRHLIWHSELFEIRLKEIIT
jgi:hypothetical protein